MSNQQRKRSFPLSIPARRIRLLFFSITLVCLLCVHACSAMADNLFSPFIETHQIGWIDWDAGYIYGKARVYLSENQGTDLQALGAARVLASGNILKLAAAMRIDADHTLQTLDHGRAMINLKAVIKDQEYHHDWVNQTDAPYHEVIRRASFHGIEGLSIQILPYLPSKRRAPVANPMFPDAALRSGRGENAIGGYDPDAWLVLDARRVSSDGRLAPALFPRVLSESGLVVYDAGIAERDMLAKRGMVRYVTATPAFATRTQIGSFGLWRNLWAWLTVDNALAGNDPIDASQPKKKRKKRKKLIVKEVLASQGLMKTNLVISEKDARELISGQGAAKILKKCRVIIVVSPPFGGVEGSLLHLLAGLPG